MADVDDRINDYQNNWDDISEVMALPPDINEQNIIKIRVDNKNSQRRTEGIEKDMKQMNKKFDGVSREIKDIKKLLKYQSNIRPFPTTYLDEEDHFPLLPKLPLTKKKQTMNMETYILDNAEYKRQLVI